MAEKVGLSEIGPYLPFQDMPSTLSVDHNSRKGRQRPFWVDNRLYPFTDHYLDIDGISIHYLDEGTGPTLLFLHGNPTWSFLYRNIIHNLRRDFRCIAPDYPGFGLSTAPLGFGFTPSEYRDCLETLIDRLALKDIVIMVHDWGGPIGLGLAGRRPDRFRGLIIGNSWAWPVNGNWRFEAFSRLLGGPVGRFLILRFNLFVEGLLPLGVCRRSLPREVMAMYRGPFATRESRRPTHILPRSIIAARSYLQTVEAGLSRLTAHPTLILWGDRDPAFGSKQSRHFEALLPHHRKMILTGAGHFIQEDAPELIADAIRDWWSSLA